MADSPEIVKKPEATAENASGKTTGINPSDYQSGSLPKYSDGKQEGDKTFDGSNAFAVVDLTEFLIQPSSLLKKITLQA